MSSTFDLTQLLAIGAPPNRWIYAMAVGFTLICLIMMLVVLIQKPKGGGLSGAFGGGAGGGSSEAFIGGKVGDVLTWTTVVCFILFLLLAMGMTWGIKGGSLDEDETDTELVEDESAGENPGTAPAAETAPPEPILPEPDPSEAEEDDSLTGIEAEGAAEILDDPEVVTPAEPAGP